MQIYERYGGFSAIRRIVSDFYDRILDEPELAPFFEHIEMARLIDHQTKFIVSITGGPASFTDVQLQRAHARLGITSEQFRAVAELLKETLEDHGFADSDVAEVMRHVRQREGSIVSGAKVSDA
ncbi:group 1 truncated hemoglobin [Marinicauda algicola]|uniref:Group 1 truncated hemoglobin n=1 Tax=Marinicauda algicola TaxID=2029849 RepID=A0A4S2H0I3_9PROT|nr:group 1 truncated hemoglobin [Marinicauda algicola]TGY89037.1 group 1 truncated hemoglobin [Marinicauda algicola]